MNNLFKDIDQIRSLPYSKSAKSFTQQITLDSHHLPWSFSSHLGHLASLLPFRLQPAAKGISLSPQHTRSIRPSASAVLIRWAALHSDATVATYPSPLAHHPCPTYPLCPPCTPHMVCPYHVPCVCSPVRAGAWLALSTDTESMMLRTLPVRSRHSVSPYQFINGWNTIIPVKTIEDVM